MLRILTTLTLLSLTVLLTAQVERPGPTEEEKKRALAIAYAMNGFSMVRWGSIDLTSLLNPVVEPEPQEFIGPLQPAPELRKRDKLK